MKIRMASTPDLTKEHFLDILNDVTGQVFSGKGTERHGHGDTFAEQPWVAISRNVGDGFVLGQALKKVMELRSFDNVPQYKREAIGAIVYLVMAIMWKEHDAE